MLLVPSTIGLQSCISKFDSDPALLAESAEFGPWCVFTWKTFSDERIVLKIAGNVALALSYWRTKWRCEIRLRSHVTTEYRLNSDLSAFVPRKMFLMNRLS